MVHLRATQKLLRLLPQPVETVEPPGAALGDWYVNRIVVDRRGLLILVSSTSLLPILISARDVRTLPSRLPEIVASRIERLGIEASVIDAELRAMGEVLVGRTLDRSVLGTTVEFGRDIPAHLPVGTWTDEDLSDLEDRLETSPCRASRRTADVIFPRDKARELLNAQWALSNIGVKLTRGRIAPPRSLPFVR